MKPTYQQLESELAQSEIALVEQREELAELYEYCAIIEDVLCAQNGNYVH